MRIYTQTDMEEYIFVKSSDDKYVNEIYRILFHCGLNMAKQLLFHWIKPYSKTSIKTDCDTKHVVLVRDSDTELFTSTFQMFVNEEGNLYVRKIATDPRFEGKGIGKRNMRFMEDYAKNHSCPKVCLDVYKKSKHAINFYIKLGFIVTGETRARLFGELIMEKNVL